MNMDDDLPHPKKIEPKDLEIMAIDELQEYIEELQDEIKRAQDMISKKQSGRAAAESFFKK